MADALENQGNIGADAQQQLADANAQDNNAAGRTYSEEHVKQLIKERDEAKKKLREVEKSQEDEKNRIEQEKATASGYYTKLTETMQKKEQKWKDRIGQIILASVAAEYHLMDMDDVKLMNIPVDVDEDFEIKNLDDIKRGFDEFKMKKPYKFKNSDGTLVPQTDNAPFTQPTTAGVKLADIGKMSKEEREKNRKALEAQLRRMK